MVLLPRFPRKTTARDVALKSIPGCSINRASSVVARHEQGVEEVRESYTNGFQNSIYLN